MNQPKAPYQVQKTQQGDQWKKHNNGTAVSVFGKIPPQDREMEEVVLGAILLEKDKLFEVLDIIPHEDCFYVEANRKIYAAIRNEESLGNSIDMMTIAAALNKTGELEIIGGAYYLTQLTMNVVTSAHVELHARVIMEKYMLRELIHASGQFLQHAYDETTDVFDLLSFAEQRVSDISSTSISNNYKSAPELASEARDKLIESSKRTSDFIGIDTGYYYLNIYTKGWQAPNLIIIGARPSVGKTALALNLALNALRNGIGVGFFSLEMASVELSERLLSAMSGVELGVIQSGRLTPDEMTRYDRAYMEYRNFNFQVDDNFSLNSMALRSKARKMKKKHDVQIIIIDYLQLMDGNPHEKKGVREQIISGISRDLKKVAKELVIPVIALSQLNRSVETRAVDNRGGGKIPNLSDLRESGAIEQDADIVMFLHGPRAGEQTEHGQVEQETTLTRYIKIDKNRSGSCETVKLVFNQTTQKFSDPDESSHSSPFAGLPAYIPGEDRRKQFEDDTPF